MKKRSVGLCVRALTTVALVAASTIVSAQSKTHTASAETPAQSRQTSSRASPASLKEVVDKYMLPYLAEQHNPGAIVALSVHGERSYFTYGKAVDSGTSFTPTTLVEIGSCTKLFTVTLFALAIAHHQMSPNDSIQKYMPHGYTLQPLAQQITPLQLADQSSGMPRMPTDLSPIIEKWGIEDYSKADFFKWLSKWQPASAPPAPYLYSNAAFGLLGYLIEDATGVPWEKAVNDNIAGPLGMRDTVLSPNPEQMGRIATGHTPDGKDTPVYPMDAWFASGSLRSTALDMLRFGEANLGHEQTDGKPVPSRLISAMKVTQAPIYAIPDGLILGVQGQKQGMAWTMDVGDKQDGSQSELWKAGNTPGYSTAILINPSKDMVIFIAVNQGANRPKDVAIPLGRSIP